MPVGVVIGRRTVVRLVRPGRLVAVARQMRRGAVAGRMGASAVWRV